MAKVEISKGQMSREWDSQPLKSKIVATIGGPQESYKDGVYNLNLERVGSPFTYEYLIENFIRNGADVIRLNVAYMTEEAVHSFFESLRGKLTIEETAGKLPRIAILTDLPGPRIRFENFPKEGINVQRGGKFTIYFEKEVGGTASGATVCINEKALKKYDEEAFRGIIDQIETRINRGEELRIIEGDGEVMMRIIPSEFSHNKSEAILKCEVIKEGKMGNKRFSVKDVDFTIASFTKEDEEKLNILFKVGAFRDDGLWAFVGLSFTQSADDVLRVKEYIEKKVREQLEGEGKEFDPSYVPAIIAKIETARGYRNREEILDVADGIMVARGDLGAQMDIEKIGPIQKELIKLCNKRGKPVITATQMLRSMTASLEPTRAEVMDVFNSILDGTDAVMLSEETSQGCYPFHAICKIASIASEAEHFFEKVEVIESKRRELAIKRYQEFLTDAEETIEQGIGRIEQILTSLAREIASAPSEPRLNQLKWRRDLYQEKLTELLGQRTTDSITQAACINSENKKMKAIIALTASGRTAQMISRFKPNVKIIGATHDDYNVRKMLLCYGVTPINFGNVCPEAGPGEMFNQAAEAIIRESLLDPERGAVLICGDRPKQRGTTNTMQIQEKVSSVP